jgi:hypothetical protein
MEQVRHRAQLIQGLPYYLQKPCTVMSITRGAFLVLLSLHTSPLLLPSHWNTCQAAVRFWEGHVKESHEPHRFRGYAVEGVKGESRHLRQHWLVEWVRELKDRWGRAGEGQGEQGWKP